MFRIVIIIAIFLVLTYGHESGSAEQDCVCVPKQFCSEDGTDECGPFTICCPLKKVIHRLQNGPDDDLANITKQCGGRNENGIFFKLVNQDLESQFGEFPWMIEISTARRKKMFLKLVYSYLAGGSLINPSVVLTAAHKVHDQNITTLRIRAGEWDQRSTNEPLTHQDRSVVRMVIHEQFLKSIGANSVALLFLDEPFKIQKHINTICLPPPSTSFDNVRCFVTGWGADARSNVRQRVNILKNIDVPVVPHDECQRMLRKTKFGKRFRLNRNFLCAGGEEGKDSCDGDGGSPLVCPIPNVLGSYYLAGFVVGGTGNCGVTEEPAIYAKISNYIDWITARIAFAGL